MKPDVRDVICHQHGKAVVDQLAHCGHLVLIKRIVEDSRPGTDVLLPLAAVRAAIDHSAKMVLHNHLESCLRNAVTNGFADDEWERSK